jgi:CBS domain-containing protein
MTKDVLTVGLNTSIHEAARLMVEHGVSGLPVVDSEGHVAGIISEGDLIVRQKPRERISWRTLFFRDGERLAREYRKATGTTVGEVMTRSVISVSPDLPIGSAAEILDSRGIHRLPVVTDGYLVGIISRKDLVKALTAPPEKGAPLSDARLVGEMTDRLAREPWVSNRGIIIQAKDGVLSLWGAVATQAEKSALETMARAIDGVKGVDNHLLVRSTIPPQ